LLLSLNRTGECPHQVADQNHRHDSDRNRIHTPHPRPGVVPKAPRSLIRLHLPAILFKLRCAPEVVQCLYHTFAVRLGIIWRMSPTCNRVNQGAALRPLPAMPGGRCALRASSHLSHGNRSEVLPIGLFMKRCGLHR
jgi:hypothetical protein